MPLDNVNEFVSGARDGDPVSLEALLAAVWDDAFRIARAIVLDDSDAQDAAQDACAIVYATIASLRSADAFPAWFYRIVVRCATQLAKRRVRGSPTIEERAGAVAAPVDRIDLQRAIETLPLGIRVPLILHYSRTFARPISRVPCLSRRQRYGFGSCLPGAAFGRCSKSVSPIVM